MVEEEAKLGQHVMFVTKLVTSLKRITGFDKTYPGSSQWANGDKEGEHNALLTSQSYVQRQNSVIIDNIEKLKIMDLQNIYTISYMLITLPKTY